MFRIIIAAMTVAVASLTNTLSRLSHRKRSLWAFGSGFGEFEGNSKYLFIWINEYHDEIETVWIAADEETARRIRNLGYCAYRRWSLKGVFYALRASRYIYSSYPSDINLFFFGGSQLINLWHGVGIKKIEYNTRPKVGFRNLLYWHLRRANDPSSYAKPHIFLSTSGQMTEHFGRSFRIPRSSFIESSYPRNIGFKDGRISKVTRDYDNGIEPVEFGSLRVCVYVPTWSSYGSSLEFLQTRDEISRVQSTLESLDAVLFIKPHPNETFPDGVLTDRIKHWPASCDIYRFLHKIDVLITDYSSIYYDFISAGGNRAICYLPMHLVRDEMELAFPQADNLPQTRATNLEELCQRLDEIIRLEGPISNRERAIRDRFFSFPERGFEYIVAAIMSRSTTFTRL